MIFELFTQVEIYNQFSIQIHHLGLHWQYMKLYFNQKSFNHTLSIVRDVILFVRAWNKPKLSGDTIGGERSTPLTFARHTNLCAEVPLNYIIITYCMRSQWHGGNERWKKLPFSVYPCGQKHGGRLYRWVMVVEGGESINKRNCNHCFWFDDFWRKERGKCFRIELAFVSLRSTACNRNGWVGIHYFVSYFSCLREDWLCPAYSLTLSSLIHSKFRVKGGLKPSM